MTHRPLIRGDAGLSRASVQLALDRLQTLKDSSATDQLATARKVMGTQAFMRARGRKLRDQEGRAAA